MSVTVTAQWGRIHARLGQRDYLNLAFTSTHTPAIPGMARVYLSAEI